MSDDWFSEFVYQIVVHRGVIGEHMMAVLSGDVIVLPPWDPMGALACHCGDAGDCDDTGADVTAAKL